MPVNGHNPTGSVEVYDGATLLQSTKLRAYGMVNLPLRQLAVGVHPLSVVYSGDAFNPSGRSAPVDLTVEAKR